MLQIDHIYEFLYKEIFNEFELYHLPFGFPKLNPIISDIMIFTPNLGTANKIFFYDQEPIIDNVTDRYLDIYNFPEGYTIEEIKNLQKISQIPYGIKKLPAEIIEFHLKNTHLLYPQKTLVVSEKSKHASEIAKKYNCYLLYYFYHGFASLDWYRGHYALNSNKQIVKQYNYDFITFNRIITGDRSYRIYFLSLLKEHGLLDQGLASFNVTDNQSDNWRDEISDSKSKLSEHARRHAEQYLTNMNKLSIDGFELSGSASADIPRDIKGYWPNNDFLNVDACWNIITETVFYYDKLHLTEKVFKPIVSKQPFMLLAAPNNLAFLRSYGFKTFAGIIDESYDDIKDNDARVEAVVSQLKWYCSLSDSEKMEVMKEIEPIIEHNFHWFYNDFKHIVTTELLVNTKNVFKQINEDDSHINYRQIYELLTK